MITLTSWQPHGRCQWCERNGGCPTADFGVGFHRNIPLCLRCLTHAVRIRRRECGSTRNAEILVRIPPDVIEATSRRSHPVATSRMLNLQPTVPRLDCSQAPCYFRPDADKPFIATATAIALYGLSVILDCLHTLQHEAERQWGLDEVQVFEGRDKPEALWFLDQHDDVVVLLPSDY
jgi:hypothetical protein